MKRLILLSILVVGGISYAGEIDLNGKIIVPYIMPGTRSGAPGITSTATQLIDASGEKQAATFLWSSTNTIHAIGFAVGNVTTGDSADVRLETTNAGDKKPSGTLYCTNSSGTASITVANGYQIATLVSDCLPTLNSEVAVVVQHPGNTLSARIGLSLGDVTVNYGSNFSSTTSGGYVRQTGPPNLTFINPSGSYFPIDFVSPYSFFPTTNATTTMLQIGNVFTLPYSCVLSGYGIWNQSSRNTQIVLYSSATALETIFLSSNTLTSGAGGISFFNFSSTYSFSANQPFRIMASTITPAGGGNSVFYLYQATSTQHLAADFTLGTGVIASRASAATITSINQFSDDPTARATIYAIVSKVTTPQNSRGYIGP